MKIAFDAKKIKGINPNDVQSTAYLSYNQPNSVFDPNGPKLTSSEVKTS